MLTNCCYIYKGKKHYWYWKILNFAPCRLHQINSFVDHFPITAYREVFFFFTQSSLFLSQTALLFSSLFLLTEFLFLSDTFFLIHPPLFKIIHLYFCICVFFSFPRHCLVWNGFPSSLSLASDGSSGPITCALHWMSLKLPVLQPDSWVRLSRTQRDTTGRCS